MSKGISDQAVRRVASLRLGGDSSADIEDVPEWELEPTPEQIDAELTEDAQYLYERLMNELAKLMAKRYYAKCLPKLFDMIVSDPEALWGQAYSESRYYREDDDY